jgi:hypothetical protein
VVVVVRPVQWVQVRAVVVVVVVNVPRTSCDVHRRARHENPQASVVVLCVVAGLNEEWQIFEVLGSR